MNKVKTTNLVWQAIKGAHKDNLVVFESYSAPDGDMLGDPSRAVMKTTYGLKGADFPLMSAESSWIYNSEWGSERHDETHEYWLICNTKEEE